MLELKKTEVSGLEEQVIKSSVSLEDLQSKLKQMVKNEEENHDSNADEDNENKDEESASEAKRESDSDDDSAGRASETTAEEVEEVDVNSFYEASTLEKRVKMFARRTEGKLKNTRFEKRQFRDTQNRLRRLRRTVDYEKVVSDEEVKWDMVCLLNHMVPTCETGDGKDFFRDKKDFSKKECAFRCDCHMESRVMTQRLRKKMGHDD